MDVLPSKDEAPSASLEHAKRRHGKGVSKEWNTFKPLIRKLYLDEGKTLLQIAEELKLSHAFKPTSGSLVIMVWFLLMSSVGKSNCCIGYQRGDLRKMSKGLKEEKL